MPTRTRATQTHKDDRAKTALGALRLLGLGTKMVRALAYVPPPSQQGQLAKARELYEQARDAGDPGALVGNNFEAEP